MLNKNIKLSSLQYLLDTKYQKEWLEWDPVTVMSDLGFPDQLVLEKVYVLHALNTNINSALSLPEFLLWATSIANNEHAEFEHLSIPNSLELAWLVVEAKKIAELSGQKFTPTAELGDTVGYLLRQEGFSTAISPFEFVPGKHFHPGQTEEDTGLKIKGIQAYIQFMEKTPAFTE